MAEKILIVDDDVDTLRLVGLMLQRQGYQVVAASNGSQGLAKAFEERPNLILLDVMMPDMDGYEVTRRLRKNPATASIPILMFTAKTQLDDKVTGFEVGADDYLTKPTHPTELQSHVKTLLARTTTNKPEETSATQSEEVGYVIGILSARGGLGVTTLAANLAAGLYTRTKADTVLAELTPGQGTLNLDLGLASTLSQSEILKGTTAEVTPEKVRSSLVAHGSGIKVLAASDDPTDIDLLSQAENFEALVMRLSGMARFTLVDLGSGLSASTRKVLPLCHEVLIVLEGTANSIQYTRALLKKFSELKVEKKPLSVILNNRQRSDVQIPWAQAQEKLGHSIFTTITPAPELLSQAQRMRTPAVIAHPENMTAQQMLKIADAVLEREKAR